MNRILISFVFSFMLGNAVFAQVNAGMPDAKQMEDARRQGEEAFWKKVDISSEWGAWLVSVYKPYSDKMSEAMMTTIMLPSTQIDPNGLSPEELLKKVNAGYVNYCKAVQNITPPEEFKAYHARTLELYEAMSNNIPSSHQQTIESEAAIKKLGDQVVQEIVSVLKHHSVPQDIIAEFTQAQ